MTGGELIPIRSARSERDWVELMAPAVKLAQHVANTAFVPKGLRGDPAAIVAAIMYGDEVGLGPMQSLAKIAVIEGRPSLSSEAQRALILAAGHEMWIVEATNTKVTVAGRRSGSTQESTVTWTLDDAKRAGLAGKTNWRSYPRQMLTARATAELARLIFADAVGGLLATEELEETQGPLDESPIEPDEAPKPRRKRKTTATPETSGKGEGAPPPADVDIPLPEEFPTEAPAEVGSNDSGPDIAPVPDEPEADPEATPMPPPPPPAPPAEVGNTYSNSTSGKPITKAQAEKLNIIVARLVEAEKITKSQLYVRLALWRNDLDWDNPDERDEARGIASAMAIEMDAWEGEILHWSPLRNSLTRGEAHRLIDGLQGLEM